MAASVDLKTIFKNFHFSSQIFIKFYIAYKKTKGRNSWHRTHVTNNNVMTNFEAPNILFFPALEKFSKLLTK